MQSVIFVRSDPEVGTLEDLQQLTAEMRKRDILLVLDVVVNHTSNKHYWAKCGPRLAKKISGLLLQF